MRLLRVTENTDNKKPPIASETSRGLGGASKAVKGEDTTSSIIVSYSPPDTYT